MEENPEIQNEGVKEENIVPQKSKSQIKKEKNKQKWLDDKPKRKELQKAKKKAQKEKNRIEREANQKAKGIDVHHPRPEGAEPPKTNKQIKQEFLKSIEDGQPLIIDCSSQDKLTEKELMSLCRQLGHCQAANKKAAQPAKIIVTGYQGKLKEQLTKMGGENWGFKLMENHYLDYFPKEQLVYLTGDATDDLIEIDKNTHYIIGGLVDHNRLKFATLNQAQSEGLKVIRLPIGQHIALKSSTILSVNHVFELMLKVSNGDSWKDAVQSTIPERKREGHEGSRKKARKARAKGEESKGDDNDEGEDDEENDHEGENENSDGAGNEEQIPVENNNNTEQQQGNTEMNQENNDTNPSS